MMIQNGDHAQFEIDHANTPKEQRPDWPLPSFDARDWARAWFKMLDRTPPEQIDIELMTAWFANALMRGYDEARSRMPKRRTWRNLFGFRS